MMSQAQRDAVHTAARASVQARRERAAEREASTKRARERAAELQVLETYDRARGARPFDMTHSRRQPAIRRLAEAVRASGIDYLQHEATEAELEAALDRHARRLLSRWDVGQAVVDAVADVALELGVDEPAILREHRAGDRTASITGGGRRRRNRRTPR